jgi:pSer/pThr/pTyr-binding forkhead associated (FHA) protein
MKTLLEACYELLGIPEAEQPADYYRLLGLTRYESNCQVIQNVADQRMAFVRQVAVGPHSKVSQELLNLLAEARICLLNAVRREQYNQKLERASCEKALQLRRTAELAYAGDAASGDSCGSDADLESQIVSLTERLPRRLPRFDGDDTRLSADDDTIKSLNRAAKPAYRSWIIGSSVDSDIVVNSPYVSRRHCRFSKGPQGFVIEDLNSRNGTYVNGRRISVPTSVVRGDQITFGLTVPLPWPKLESPSEVGQGIRVLRIGRSSNNEVVIQDETVSLHHAELYIDNENMILKDMGSTNGTFLNNSPERISSATLSIEAIVRFGRFRLPLEFLLTA